MLLFIVALIGGMLGYRFNTTRRGYFALALMALVFPILQIADVVMVHDRSAQTMMPLVLGLIMVVSTLIGALVHTMSPRLNA